MGRLLVRVKSVSAAKKKKKKKKLSDIIITDFIVKVTIVHRHNYSCSAVESLKHFFHFSNCEHQVSPEDLRNCLRKTNNKD